MKPGTGLKSAANYIAGTLQPKVLARTIEIDVPEAERAVRVNWTRNMLFSIGDKRITEKGNTVDSGFLQTFSFPMIKGNPATALNDVHSLVVTESFAKNLFGNEEPMGKTVKLDNSDNFTVTGVVKDLPNNTRFDFQYLIPWSYLRSKGGDDNNWGSNSTRTYVLLKQNASLASAAQKIKVLKQKHAQGRTQMGNVYLSHEPLEIAFFVYRGC